MVRFDLSLCDPSPLKGFAAIVLLGMQLAFRVGQGRHTRELSLHHESNTALGFLKLPS